MSWLFKGVDHAHIYRKYRPIYPPSLYSTVFSYLESSGITRDSTSGRFQLALDVGCGSGQSTLTLSDHFETVIGVDSSEAQLDEARGASVGHVNVTYRQAVSHDLSFQVDASVDLITVATALHWFDREQFYKACHRVLRPGGVLAAYTTGVVNVSRPAELDNIVKQVRRLTVTTLITWKHYLVA